VIGDDGERRTRRNPYAGPGKPESAYRSLERLLDAADDGGELTNSGTDNLKTLGLTAGAYRSAEQGSPVILRDGLPG